MKDPGARCRQSPWLGPLAVVAAASGTLPSSRAFADAVVRYEVREEVTAALLPAHDYGVTGMCATGTGLAPASDFAQGGSGRGEGFGAGVGGRIFYRDADMAAPRQGSTWWGLRLGAGLDLNLLYAKVATGIPDMSGKLCARVRSDGAGVQYAGSSVLLAQIPILFGAELGVGSSAEDASWHGMVLGAAWAPALSYFQPWAGTAALSASYLGTELTLDFAIVRNGAARAAGKRAAVFLLLPVREEGPLVLTLSFGAVWY